MEISEILSKFRRKPSRFYEAKITPDYALLWKELEWGIGVFKCSCAVIRFLEYNMGVQGALSPSTSSLHDSATVCLFWCPHNELFTSNVHNNWIHLNSLLNLAYSLNNIRQLSCLSVSWIIVDHRLDNSNFYLLSVIYAIFSINFSWSWRDVKKLMHIVKKKCCRFE